MYKTTISEQLIHFEFSNIRIFGIKPVWIFFSNNYISTTKPGHLRSICLKWFENKIAKHIQNFISSLLFRPLEPKNRSARDPLWFHTQWMTPWSSGPDVANFLFLNYFIFIVLFKNYINKLHQLVYKWLPHRYQIFT